MRSRPCTLFLDDQLVIVSFDAAAAFNEYFSGRNYRHRRLRTTQTFFKAKLTRHAQDLMVKENKSRTRVEEVIKNSFILNNWSCRLEKSEKWVCFFFFQDAFSRSIRGQVKAAAQTTTWSNSAAKWLSRFLSQQPIIKDDQGHEAAT